MIELVDKDITAVVITIFYMFKKIEKSLSMLIRNIEDIFLKTQITFLGRKNTLR